MTDEAEARIEEIIKGAELYGASDDYDRNPTQPRVLVDKRNPHRTVAALRDVIAERGSLYDRGVPVRLVRDRMHGGMQARPVTADAVVLLAHQICRPYVKRVANDTTAEVDAALPPRIANMYLDWLGEWQLPALHGIASAPILSDCGSIRSVNRRRTLTPDRRAMLTPLAAWLSGSTTGAEKRSGSAEVVEPEGVVRRGA